MTDDHEQRCAELYALGNQPKDVPDGLLIIGSSSCILCKQTMRHNGYPQAIDGTPITWINISEQDGLYKFYSTPGIAWSDEFGAATANGEKLGGTPLYLWIKDGAVRGSVVAYGEQPQGNLARIIAEQQAAV
jgi:hypothetical protein